MKIAILYIAIGNYVVFWDEFYQTFNHNFLVEHHKEYYIFTDHLEYFKSSQKNIILVKQENLGWPGNTLYRFEMFLKVQKQLETFDYIFFFNANYTCNREIKSSMMGDLAVPLIFVQHPGFYGRKNYYYNYERRNKSNAYIPYGEGEYYVQGCLIGGRPREFVEMCVSLSRSIRDDELRGVIAIWHDESYLNRYLIEHKDSLVLPPGFAYPEFASGPQTYDIYMSLRDKEKHIKYTKKKKRKSYVIYNLFIYINGKVREFFGETICTKKMRITKKTGRR